MNRRFLALTLLLILFHFGCGHANTVSTEPRALNVEEVKTEQEAPIPVRIENVLAHPEEYVDRMVTIEGQFMGWSGSCKFAPPETRSDWMVDAGDGCLYVSGPVPEGYSTVPGSSSIGKTISVTGRVLLDGKERPYVKIQSP